MFRCDRIMSTYAIYCNLFSVLTDVRRSKTGCRIRLLTEYPARQLLLCRCGLTLHVCICCIEFLLLHYLLVCRVCDAWFLILPTHHIIRAHQAGPLYDFVYGLLCILEYETLHNVHCFILLYMYNMYPYSVEICLNSGI